MNNPNISDVNLAIENKLKEQSILTNEKLDVNSTNENTDIFSCLNIPKVGIKSQVTDLDKNKFMKKSFEEINNLLKELCSQLNKENNELKKTLFPSTKQKNITFCCNKAIKM